jgi:hypothetical protein
MFGISGLVKTEGSEEGEEVRESWMSKEQRLRAVGRVFI